MTRRAALGLAVFASVGLAGCMAARAWSVADPAAAGLDTSIPDPEQTDLLVIADPSPDVDPQAPESWIDTKTGEQLVRRKGTVSAAGTWTVTTVPETGDAGGGRVTLSRGDHLQGEGFLIYLHSVEDLDSGRSIHFEPPLFAVGSPLALGEVLTELGEGSLEGLGSGPVEVQVAFVGEGTIETDLGTVSGSLVKTETEMKFGPAVVWREVVVLYGRAPGAAEGSRPVPIAEAVRQRTKVGPITVDSSNEVLVRAGVIEPSEQIEQAK